MGDLDLDGALLTEVAERIDLRETNRKAVETVLLRTSMHYDVEGNDAPFECIVDSATGVGKTYVLAGLIEYLALASAPAKNFLVIAPGRTIRDKTTRNFTPGHKKSLTAAMRSQPHLVTAENFDSPATRSIMADAAKTKVYVFTVQALTSKSGDGRATHEFQEGLGSSFYEWLAGLDDLVILADEHHCYRGPVFSKTIRELNPQVVVGLTATPKKADEGLVAYRYPLAAAIAHQLVKIPVIVGRRDDRNDIETKLLDGVGLLRKKELAARRYCEQNDLGPVNPVMLVVAKDIDEATEFRNILDSVTFDGGAWVDKTLLVHSKLTADEKEQALAALDAVEDPGSPVRIIINVSMLEEGWDVKNVYVIASMRASVSEVLTEQTLGRGLRLPFGEYTGIDFLDTLEVLAHERYEALLERRKGLNQSFVDYHTYAATRVLPDGTVTVVTKHEDVDTPVIAGPEPTNILGRTQTADRETDAAERDQHGVASGAAGSIIDIDTRTGQADAEANDESQTYDYEPLEGREPILIPMVTQVPKAAVVSLHDVDSDQFGRFDRLGQTLTEDFSNDLKRTKLIGQVSGSEATLGVEAAEPIQATLAFDIPLAESRKMLIKQIMATKGVQRRPSEHAAAALIVDRVIAAMGDQAGASLSAFGDRCAARLASEVSAILNNASNARFEFDDEVSIFPLMKKRTARKKRVAGHADGGFAKTIAFNGWRKNLYSHSWFDTKPEYNLANALDAADNGIAVWARLHINDVPITWNADGRRYNPDFVVLEDEGGARHGWLVETKADRDLTSAEVVAKRKAARRWSRVVNSSGKTEGVEWHYLLVGEKDVDDAQGHWKFLKGFGS